jgi:hypothetical protein
VITTLLAATLLLQSKTPPKIALTKDEVSARRFVQGFYDWYLATDERRQEDRSRGNANVQKQIPYPDDAMDYVSVMTKPEMFTKELRLALVEDRDAQKKESDFIVGLDFDPFLNSQDPYTRYVVGKVEHKGHSWLAAVHGVVDGKKNAAPDVTAKLEKIKEKWRFTNFIYAQGSNLLGILKELKNDRRK